jgi:hypothetical protein
MSMTLRRRTSSGQNVLAFWITGNRCTGKSFPKVLDYELGVKEYDIMAHHECLMAIDFQRRCLTVLERERWTGLLRELKRVHQEEFRKRRGTGICNPKALINMGNQMILADGERIAESSDPFESGYGMRGLKQRGCGPCLMSGACCRC